MPLFKDVFISYGRKESLHFATRLFERLEADGYAAWFDHVNIPKGDDFQKRIENGIESADNFVFIISPHANSSQYCLAEIEIALKLRKRIIPILHIDRDLQKIHSELGKINWIYAREREDTSLPLAQWAPIDSFERAVEELEGIIETDRDYVRKHTAILHEALKWQSRQRSSSLLLVSNTRLEAQNWLLTEFTPPKQPPCKPTDLHCEFISESRKNAENLLTDCFICHHLSDHQIRDAVTLSLARHAITCWVYDKDAQKSRSATRAVEEGIEQADNFLFFVSQNSLNSSFCQHELAHALKWNKRVIPIIVDETVRPEQLPESIAHLKRIDFSDNVVAEDYEQDVDEILNILNQHLDYYRQHKMLLSLAIRWKQKGLPSFLLRGFNLENAETWLRINRTRGNHPPTELHKEFVASSIALKGQLTTDVFIAYSRVDSDFARLLNQRLQESGKTTWFDQESIATGTDFQNELFKGIAASDNFLFIISPRAIQSSFCQEEVAYASKLNKRFIPLLWLPAEEALPPELASIQWIDFHKQPFEKSFTQLVQTLEIDRAYAHAHTLWQQRANEWNTQQRSSDFLLNATACKNAENWLKEAFNSSDLTNVDDFSALTPQKPPYPTALQVTFIVESKKAVEAAAERERTIQQQLKIRLRRGHVALAAAALLLGISMYFIILSNKNAANARSSALKVLATNLAFQSKKLLQRDPNRAVEMAHRAHSMANESSPVILQALAEAYYTPFAMGHPFYQWELREDAGVQRHAFYAPDSTLAVVVAGESEQAADSLKIYHRSPDEQTFWKLHKTLALPRQRDAFFLPNRKAYFIANPQPYLIDYSAADTVRQIPLADTTGVLMWKVFEAQQKLLVYSQEGSVQVFDLSDGQLLQEIKGKIERNRRQSKMLEELQRLNEQEKKLREREDELVVLLNEIKQVEQQQGAKPSSNDSLILTIPRQQSMPPQMVQQRVLSQIEDPRGAKKIASRKDRLEKELRDCRRQIAEVGTRAQIAGRDAFSDRNTLFDAEITENGQRILLRYSEEAQLIEARSGEVLQVWNDTYQALRFSPDGRFFVSVDTRGRATVYESSKGRAIARLRGDTADALTVFVPNTSLILSFFSNGQGFFWHRETGEITKRFSIPSGSMFRQLPLVSNSGMGVAISSGREVWVIHPQDANPPYRLFAAENPVRSLRFSEVGNLLAVEHQEFSIIYQYGVGRFERIVYLPYQARNVTFSDNEQFFAASVEDIRQDLIRQWPVRFSARRDFGGIPCDGYTSDGEHGFIINENKASIVHKDPQTVTTTLSHDAPLQRWFVALAEQKGFLTSTQDGTVHLWDYEGNRTGELPLNFFVQNDAIELFAGGQYLLLHQEDILSAWDVQRQQKLFTAPYAESKMGKVAFFPSGNLLMGLENGQLKGWNPLDEKVVLQCEHLFSPISQFAIHPSNAAIITVHPEESMLRVWSVFSNKQRVRRASTTLLNPLRDHDEDEREGKDLMSILGERFDGLTYNGSQPERLSVLREIRLPFSQIMNLSFSASGNLLAVAGKDETLVGEIMAGLSWRFRLPNPFSSGLHESIYLDFSPDEKYLLVGEEKGIWQNIGHDLLFWDLNEGQLIFRQQLPKQRSASEGIHFFPSGKLISVGTYLLPTPEGIVQWMNTRPFRSLHSREHEEFLLF